MYVYIYIYICIYVDMHVHIFIQICTYIYLSAKAYRNCTLVGNLCSKKNSRKRHESKDLANGSIIL